MSLSVPLTTYTEYTMGTVVTFTVAQTSHDASEGSDRALSDSRNGLRSADAIFSIWRQNSPINLLRKGEITLSECPPVVEHVWDHCQELREMTDGWFDPWALPGGFDPTGMVKGWAAERATEAFDVTQCSGVIVNAAGDVATRGTMNNGDVFRIGIVDPADAHRLTCVVESPGAVATSGTYERGAHLFDPKQGRRLARSASATVTGPSLATADALATALAVAGTDGLRFVERIPAYEGFVIDKVGGHHATSEFPFAC